jgi:hypothetical protein
MGLQALLAGSAFVGLYQVVTATLHPATLWALGVSAGLHALVTWGEVSLPHVTAHARLASRHLTEGVFRPWFLTGLLGGGVLPLLLLALLPNPVGLTLASIGALVGLLAFEHAYVQAGQSVPLA